MLCTPLGSAAGTHTAVAGTLALSAGMLMASAGTPYRLVPAHFYPWLSDILLVIDAGNIAALALLDLCAAFDTVNQTILLQGMRTSFGLNGTVLRGFSRIWTSSACMLPPRAVSTICRPVWANYCL